MSLGEFKWNEIRGHRRILCWAKWQQNYSSINTVKSRNPVFSDEIDKVEIIEAIRLQLAWSIRSAQNKEFVDNYCVPFDLSDVMFINRNVWIQFLQLFEIEWNNWIFRYTEEEKFHITKKYLIPRQLKEMVLKRTCLFSDPAIRHIILIMLKSWCQKFWKDKLLLFVKDGKISCFCGKGDNNVTIADLKNI